MFMVRQHTWPSSLISGFRPGESSTSLLYGITTHPKGGKRAVFKWVPWGFTFTRAARVLFWGGAVLVISAVLISLSGCASNPAPRIGHGAEEYRQLTLQALGAIHEALGALDQVASQTTPSPGVVTSFSRQVQQLQVDSFRVRARSQAIRARGDAYFQAWSEVSESGKAAAYLPRMRESFERIKLYSQQAGEAFKPFFTDLRKVSVLLETTPDAIGTADNKQLIAGTREQGTQVVQKLELLSNELQAIIPVLAEAKAKANL